MSRYKTTWTFITWNTDYLQFPHDEAIRQRRRWWRRFRKAFTSRPWGTSRSGAVVALGSPEKVQAELPTLPYGGAARLWPLTDAQYGRSVEVLSLAKQSSPQPAEAD